MTGLVPTHLISQLFDIKLQVKVNYITCVLLYRERVIIIRYVHCVLDETKHQSVHVEVSQQNERDEKEEEE